MLKADAQKREAKEVIETENIRAAELRKSPTSSSFCARHRLSLLNDPYVHRVSCHIEAMACLFSKSSACLSSNWAVFKTHSGWSEGPWKMVGMLVDAVGDVN